jgi:uncharacterized BrkB/YihY/UPF0761 family membrane protein
MDSFTFGITIGILLGIAIGVSIGIAIGKKQKPWSELTEEEKKYMKIIIGVGVILLLIGLIVNLWLFFNW